MPRYKGVLSLEDNGPDTPIVHLFDYSTEEGQDSGSKSSYRKQVIAVESCIYLGRRTLASIKASQSKPRNKVNKDEVTNGKAGTGVQESEPSTNQSKPRKNSENKENKDKPTNGKLGTGAKESGPSTNQSKPRKNSENKENKDVTNVKGVKETQPSSNQSKPRKNSENKDTQPSTNQSKPRKNSENKETQPSTSQSKPRKNSENKENKEMTNQEGAKAVLPDKNETNVVNKEDIDTKDVKTKENVKNYLKEGQEFQAYILKCPNGPYDYAMKIWDTGRAAPSEIGYPKEGEEVEGLVVDRSEDFLTVACGPNIAFARRKTFLCAGVDPDDLSLPFARLKVSLRRLQEREAQVPAAGWEATPTQVMVAPYDIY